MRYKHKITGNILVTDCVISGEDFVLIEDSTKAPTVKETKPKTTTTTKRVKK